jgi:fused signal recognition particle receptor
MSAGFLKNLVDTFRGRPVDWDELEETLIRADLGVSLSMLLVERLQARGFGVDALTVRDVLGEELISLFPPEAPPLQPLPDRPKVCLLLGVNGTGKTTTTAKLAHFLQERNHSVLLAAGDTFRAAAIEQLVHWGERLGLQVISGQYQSDPAALCHDAYRAAVSRDVQFLLCDTAGRLHTKSNLMQELGKVVRTLAKQGDGVPDEKWLVIDATTGMNGLVQAREFNATVGLTGVIITKMDGSGRGGIAAAIQHELGITPRFLGTGEQPGDLTPFEREAFVGQLLGTGAPA